MVYECLDYSFCQYLPFMLKTSWRNNYTLVGIALGAYGLTQAVYKFLLAGYRSYGRKPYLYG